MIDGMKVLGLDAGIGITSGRVWCGVSCPTAGDPQHIGRLFGVRGGTELTRPVFDTLLVLGKERQSSSFAPFLRMCISRSRGFSAVKERGFCMPDPCLSAFTGHMTMLLVVTSAYVSRNVRERGVHAHACGLCTCPCQHTSVHVSLLSAYPRIHGLVRESDQQGRKETVALCLVEVFPWRQLPVSSQTVGNEIRKEYTALGDYVNLSARLMGKAGPREIFVDV